MSSSSHPLRVLGALVAGTVLIPVTGIGLLGTFTDTGPLRPIMAMAGIGGLLGVGGAFATVYSAVRAGRVEQERVRQARVEASTREVVARWRLDRAEARAAADRAWAARKLEVAVTAVGLFLVGWAFLWSTERDAAGAFAAGAFLGVLYLVIGLLKYGMEHQSAIGPAATDVIVFPDAVYVMGTWHTLVEDRELLGVSLDGDLLEFRVRWQTRNGPAEDHIHAPVPPERRADAELVVAFFSRAGGSATTR